jgi:hypothetical protein
MIVLITVLHQAIMMLGRIMTGQLIHLLPDLHRHLQEIALQAVLITMLINRIILPGANHLPIVTVRRGTILPDQVIHQDQAIPQGVAVQVILLAEVVQVILQAEAVLVIPPGVVPLDHHLREAGDNQQA